MAEFSQWAQATSGVVPLVIGIGSSVLFKPWIYAEDQILTRVALAKERLTEQLAKAHDNLILRLNLGEPARGGQSTADGIRPDLLADFASELFRANEFLFQIRLLKYEGTRSGQVITFLSNRDGVGFPLGVLTVFAQVQAAQVACLD